MSARVRGIIGMSAPCGAMSNFCLRGADVHFDARRRACPAIDVRRSQPELSGITYVVRQVRSSARARNHDDLSVRPREYNLANGGWAQFLWNCFDYRRPAIESAKEGYLLIGAPEQSAALETLRTLCERDERECEALLERSEAEFDEDRYGSPPFFAEFTSRSYSAPASDWEPLFSERGVYEKRLVWLAANEARVRRAMGILD